MRVKLIKLLWRGSAGLLLCSITASLGTAALMLFLLATISQFLTDPNGLQLQWWQLLVVILLSGALQIGASMAISGLSQRTVGRLRADFVDRVVHAPLASLESEGHASLLSALLEDATRVSDAIPGVIVLARDLTFMLASFVYLASLSLTVTGITLSVIFVAAFIVFPLQALGARSVQALRNQYQSLFAMFRNLFDGIKQIKLSSRQHDDLMGEIGASESLVARSNFRAFLALSFANAVAVVVFLLLMEIMIFGGISAFSDRHVMTTYLLVLMFILGPLQSITSAAGSLAKARIALERIGKLQKQLQDANSESPIDAPAQVLLPAPATSVVDSRAWRELRISNLHYSYETAGRQIFEIGPLDFVLQPGELFYVVGGNGSGKTTLGKLLAGLYVPASGEIHLGGVLVNDTNRAWYRQHFSAVFSDFCLFDGLAGSAKERYSSEEPELVKLLKLDHILDEAKGIFAQSGSFSSGEKHRTALLLACLDDRPIYIFDEFAADQDPDCKELFYREILKRMRDKGKLVIIITHDVRYFDQADRIITLERGLRPVLVAA